MKEIGKILVYLAATILLGALLAPALFAASHHVGLFSESDFQRFFNRAVLIAAIALLFPLVRSMRIRNLCELDLEKNTHPFRDVAAGFTIAFATTALFGTTLTALHLYRLKSEWPWDKLGLLVPTAATVAVVEEMLFRGGIQGVVQRSAPKSAALFFVAALFSLVHFLKPPEEAIAKVTWLSGFALIPKVFGQFGEPMLVVAGFITLLLVGLILGYARLRTRSLWMPIGLHAGWILSKMGFSKISKRTADAWPWFGKDLLVGIGPVVVLLFTGVIVVLYLQYAAAGRIQKRG